MTFRLGVVQPALRMLEPQENLYACLESMKGKSADLWVLPELATSGYAFKSRAEAASVAERIDGPTCRLLQDYARIHDCAVVIGLPEKAGGRLYNSSALVTAKKIVPYRKVHLFAEEKRWFSPGNLGFGVETVKGVKVGMMVCFDWFFPEACRTLALKGAQVIAHPSNLVLPWGPDAMRTRSLENRVFSATANRVGTERGLRFIGRSQIVGTRGELLVRASEKAPSASVAVIAPDLAAGKRLNRYNDLLKDRRPAFYR